MKKTSRRKFGKQLAGAIAATAVSPLVLHGEPAVTQQQPAKPGRKGFRTHDTPPPLEFVNGSLTVESAIEFNSTGLNGTRREYRIHPRTGMVIAPGHIRVLHGNGEQLFYRDDTEKYLVIIEMRDANGDPSSSMIINAQSTDTQDKFVIDVERGRTLQLGNPGNNDKPSSGKRQRRYRHSGAANMTMYKITIRDLASGNEDTFMPRSLQAQGDEIKVMIWLEPWV